MSDYEANEHGGSEVPEFSLTQAVEEIRQQGSAQIENLRENQKTLSSLQETFLEIKKKGEMVEQELRSTIREIMVKEAEIEQLEQQKQVLNDRCTSISNENAGLQMRTKEEEDNVRKVLAQFGSYRKKMEGHRLAVWLAASQGETQKVLGKKALVRKLKKKREELRDDLQNPNGSTVEKAKREMDALKVEISAMKETVAEKWECLVKETESHTPIKEETEIQNKRFEAIVRRLHLQLSRAQAAHRQVCDDVCRMESELAELKLRL